MAIAGLAACGGGAPKPPDKPVEVVPQQLPGIATLAGAWHSTDIDGWGYDLTLTADKFTQTIARTSGGPCKQSGTLQDYQQAYGSPYVTAEENRAAFGGDAYGGKPAGPPPGTRLALVMTYETNECNADFSGAQMIGLAFDYDGSAFTLRFASNWGTAEESHRYTRVVAPAGTAPTEAK